MKILFLVSIYFCLESCTQHKVNEDNKHTPFNFELLKSGKSNLNTREINLLQNRTISKENENNLLFAFKLTFALDTDIQFIAYSYQHFFASGGKPVPQKNGLFQGHPIQKDYLQIKEHSYSIDSLFALLHPTIKKSNISGFGTNGIYMFDFRGKNYFVGFFKVITHTSSHNILYFPLLFDISNTDKPIHYPIPQTKESQIACFGDYNADGYLDYLTRKSEWLVSPDSLFIYTLKGERFSKLKPYYCVIRNDSILLNQSKWFKPLNE